MKFYINGSDISRITLSNLDEEGSLQTFESSPELYLQKINNFLEAAKVLPAEIEVIYIVVGPGSATALRSSLSIVNTIKFAFETRVIGVRKAVDEQDSETIEKILNNNFDQAEESEYLKPIYENEPKITKSKKDQLGRS